MNLNRSILDLSDQPSPILEKRLVSYLDMPKIKNELEVHFVEDLKAGICRQKKSLECFGCQIFEHLIDLSKSDCSNVDYPLQNCRLDCHRK